MKPAAASARMWYSINGTPATCTSGLGVCSVKGRMRSPLPAARIIAFMHVPFIFRQAGEQLTQLGELRPTRQHSFYI